MKRFKYDWLLYLIFALAGLLLFYILHTNSGIS